MPKPSPTSVAQDVLLGLQQKGITSPMLEARLAYTDAAQLLNQHLLPMVGQARVFPNLMNPQASGRVGTARPPIGNFTADKRYGPHGIRDVVQPDEGMEWACFDYSAVEARVLAHACQDPDDLEAFAKEEDIHSRTLVRLMWADWGKRHAYAKGLSYLRGDTLGAAVVDQTGQVLLAQMLSEAGDQRIQETSERWAPSLRAPIDHESWAGRGCTSLEWKQVGQQAGEPDRAYTAPTFSGASAVDFAWAAWVICGGPPPDWQGGDDRRRRLAKNTRYALQYALDHRAVARYAVEMKMTKQQLWAFGKLYLASKPWLMAWKRRVWADCWRAHESRTAFGRRRMLVGDRLSIMKEGLNHQIQGTVADILKIVIAAVCTTLGCRKAYQTHDGCKFEFKRGASPTVELKTLVEREWELWGRPLFIPASWEVVGG